MNQNKPRYSVIELNMFVMHRKKFHWDILHSDFRLPNYSSICVYIKVFTAWTYPRRVLIYYIKGFSVASGHLVKVCRQRFYRSSKATTIPIPTLLIQLNLSFQYEAYHLRIIHSLNYALLMDLHVTLYSNGYNGEKTNWVKTLK